MPSASAIRSYGTAFLAKDGRLSRVASGATCAALDSPPSGAILRLDRMAEASTLPEAIGTMSPILCHSFLSGSNGGLAPTLPLCGFTPASPGFHSHSGESFVSDSVHAGVRDILGLHSTKRDLPGPSRQFQATLRSPQDRVRRETTEMESSVPNRLSRIGPRSPFFRLAAASTLGWDADSGGLSQTQRFIDFAAHPEPVQ